MPRSSPHRVAAGAGGAAHRRQWGGSPLVFSLEAAVHLVAVSHLPLVVTQMVVRRLYRLRSDLP